MHFILKTLAVGSPLLGLFFNWSMCNVVAGQRGVTLTPASLAVAQAAPSLAASGYWLHVFTLK